MSVCAIEHEVLPDDASVRTLLTPINKYLSMEGVTELCINRPGEVFVEIGPRYHRFDVPELTMKNLHGLAIAVSIYAKQSISAEKPILSATLPNGERIQIIVSPVLETGACCICIRVPSEEVFSMESYNNNGYFNRYIWGKPDFSNALMSAVSGQDERMMRSLEERRVDDFLLQAVHTKKTIAVVGDTGSGKTTFMKSLCQEINPSERLVTIEDVRELFLNKHANRVHLLYSKGDQGVAKVTPADLIAACMRLKPDRVLLAELRGSEAFDFLKLLTTGHAGSITSFHAESCALAAERYVLMCKEHPQAAIYDVTELKRLVTLTFDVVIHVKAEVILDESGDPIKKERYITEIDFNPLSKLRTRFGDGEVVTG